MAIRVETAVGLSLLLILMLAIVVPVAMATIREGSDESSSLSAYGDDWDDVSNVRRNLERDGYEAKSMVSSPVLLDSITTPERTLVIICGVEKQYTSVEIDKIKAFVKDGGRVILAGDYGYENDLAEAFGIYFYGRPIIDSEFDINRSYVYSYAELNGTDYRLTMSTPTGLQINSQEVAKIARSGNNSYVDISGTGIVDIDAFRGPVPTIAMTSYGDGFFVTIADASFFINGQWGDQNGIFIKALVDYLLPGGGDVIFDESRHNYEATMAPAYSALTSLVVVFNYAMLYMTVLAILIAMVAFAVVTIKVKEDWGHRFNTLRLKRRPASTTITKKDCLTVRSGMISTMAQKLNLSPQEADDLKGSREAIGRYVRDKSLVSFIAGSDPGDQQELMRIIEKFRMWKNE